MLLAHKVGIWCDLTDHTGDRKVVDMTTKKEKNSLK